LDFDIFSMSPMTRGSPALPWWAAGGPCARPLAVDLDVGRLDPQAVGVLVGLVGDHALREQAGERLGDAQHALVLQGAGDEAGVEQVQHRVLDAADILVDRQPVVGGGLVDRRRRPWGR
jgi:hypothetical protein